jgi:tetratricopeptide (TPR) repeat protein
MAVAITERAQADFLFLADKLANAGSAEESDARRNDARNTVLRAATAYTRWCKILALRHKTADAIARCNRAIEINNRSAEGYAFLALAYDRNNEYDKAIAAAQRAIDLDPDYAEGYAFLAEAYADKAPFEKRNLETAQKAVKANDKSAFAHRNLGWVYETEGNYRQAALSYQRATELMPSLSYFYMDLCRAQKVRALIDEAIAACLKATELDPQNAEAFDRLGMMHFDRFENQKALAQFERATEIDPNYATAYGHQGWVYYFRLYSWEKAVTAFEKALELGANKLNPGLVAEFYVELGWSYYRLSRCGEGRTAFDRALGLLARNAGPGAANLVQQAQDGLRACEGRK